jgi:hypothetical protein
MSTGYGIVQRNVLDYLAQNPADPMDDFDVPPFYRSWTRLGDMAARIRCHPESARRAIRKMDDKVETALLRPIKWYVIPGRPDQKEERAKLIDGARSRVVRRVRPHRMREFPVIDSGIERVRIWEYPRRIGNVELHARLALAPEDAKRYWELEEEHRQKIHPSPLHRLWEDQVQVFLALNKIAQDDPGQKL